MKQTPPPSRRTASERMRRHAFISATITAIERAGSLDVTMSEIATRAGVSPALLHHYFGTKDELMVAAMGHLLREFGRRGSERLRHAKTHRERLSAIVSACFDPSQFSRESIAAWLIFYLYARRSADAARLLRIYFRRLETNLLYSLYPLVGEDQAPAVAAATGAMIDGVWLRQALTPLTAPDPEAAAALVERYIDAEITP